MRREPQVGFERWPFRDVREIVGTTLVDREGVAAIRGRASVGGHVSRNELSKALMNPAFRGRQTPLALARGVD